MSEETKKTPCIEAASFFHELSNSSFLPPSLEKFHPCWFTEDSFADFISCNSVVALPPKVLHGLIVQGLDKGLVQSRAHRPHGSLYQEGGLQISGGSSKPWPAFEVVPRCFLVFSVQKGRF